MRGLLPGLELEQAQVRAVPAADHIQQSYRKQRKQPEPGHVALTIGDDDGGGQQRPERRPSVTAHLKCRLGKPITPARRQPRHPRGLGVKGRRAHPDQCGSQQNQWKTADLRQHQNPDQRTHHAARQ